MNKPTVICLLGPTASGKTDLAMALRQHLPVELVSVDSAMVYRGMDIGTAKPSAAELAAAPHRLIDIRDPAEPYSAADFCADAEREVADILAAGRIPLLVGGTMLYFKALLEGLATMPAADPRVRADIEREAAEHGWPHIHAQLRAVDPDLAAEIHPNHSQRLSRALEVYRISGKTMSHWRAEQGRAEQGQGREPFGRRHRVVQLALLPRDRAVLHRRIEQRFAAMLEQGLIDEVRRLRARGDLHLELPSMRAVGYRQVWQYLEGEFSREQLLEKGFAATRQLAKRQCTWLQSWPALEQLSTEDAAGNSRPKEEIVRNALNFLASGAI